METISWVKLNGNRPQDRESRTPVRIRWIRVVKQIRVQSPAHAG